MPNGARVLVANCGVGHRAESLHNAGFDVTAFDSDERKIEAARARVPKRRLEKRELLWLHVEHEGFPPVFDAALCVEGEATEDLVRRLYAALRPGGVLVVAAGMPLPAGATVVRRDVLVTVRKM